MKNTHHIFKSILIAFLSIFSIANAQVLNLNLSKNAFSSFGSYMAISKTAENNNPENLYIRDISGNRLWQWNGIFKIEVIKNGIPVAYTTEFKAEKLTLMCAENETIEFSFQQPEVLRVRGKNLNLRLTQSIKDNNSYYIPLDSNTIRAQMGGFAHFFIKKLNGKMTVDGIQTLERGDREKLHLILDFTPNAKGIFELAINQYTTGITVKDFSSSFDSCVVKNRRNFDTFLSNKSVKESQYMQTKYEAKYINWSSVVAPRGFAKRPGMYMSKINMRAVWSWDHCFNALASLPNKSFAYEQFILPFDYLDKTGALPDLMTDHNVTWGFVKPPIHGWALQKMQDKGLKLTKNQLNECYNSLEKWTNFWFNFMDDNQNGFPQYNHGNDSGWDNSTYFDNGYSVENADLCAFLILQMDCLAKLATLKGNKNDASRWNKKSDDLLKNMINYFWDGKKFICKRTIDKSYKAESKSLMRFMPLVLGKKLPDNIRKIMLEDLKTGGNITEFGLASESPTSVLYESDGYWRGPIWAPTTYLLVDALRNIGEKELAKSIAKKYCDMCKKSGFAENFEATTGAQLRDSGYTWTSSVFLLLLEEFME